MWLKCGELRGGLAGRAIRADARIKFRPPGLLGQNFLREWRHLHFRVFLPTDLHSLQFVGRFGQIVPGPKNIASPLLGELSQNSRLPKTRTGVLQFRMTCSISTTSPACTTGSSEFSACLFSFPIGAVDKQQF